MINALSKTSKISWGLSHKALWTIYNGAVLPLLSYAVTVWISALNKVFNVNKLKRVQRLVCIRIAKAYRTVSYESVCVLTGLTPIHLKLQEIATIHQVKKLNKYENQNVDLQIGYKGWTHPAKFMVFQEIK